MNDRIRITIEDSVADVRLTRPDKLNALDPAMFNALEEAGSALNQTEGLRAVVISGEGRGFCAGLDVERMKALARGESLIPLVDLSRRSHGPANLVQHVVWQWRELPVPVIAAVHGIAFGGGFQLALAADLRLVHPKTRFSILETKWGLVPDMAGTHLMRHLAREDIVRELTYTAREFSAEEALGFGFVTRLVEDPHSAGMKLAREIAARSPDAIRAAKRLLNMSTLSNAGAMLEAETAEQAETHRVGEPARSCPSSIRKSTSPILSADGLKGAYSRGPPDGNDDAGCRSPRRRASTVRQGSGRLSGLSGPRSRLSRSITEMNSKPPDLSRRAQHHRVRAGLRRRLAPFRRAQFRTDHVVEHRRVSGHGVARLDRLDDSGVLDVRPRGPTLSAGLYRRAIIGNGRIRSGTGRGAGFWFSPDPCHNASAETQLRTSCPSQSLSSARLPASPTSEADGRRLG